MNIAITGHTNIEKATNYDAVDEHLEKYNSKAFEACYDKILSGLQNFCKEKNIEFKNIAIISGMARGVDEVFAILAIRNKLKLILSIPSSIRWHKNRDYSRNVRAQAIYYDKILAYPNKEVFEISKMYNGNSYHFANFARNQHMVDISDVVFSFKCYDSTGTDDCISRAKKAGKYGGNLA